MIKITEACGWEMRRQQSKLGKENGSFINVVKTPKFWIILDVFIRLRVNE